MEKSTALAAAGSAPPRSEEIINENSGAFQLQAGNSTYAKKICQIIVQEWSNTFSFNPTDSGKHIGLVTRQNSLEACLGNPNKQKEPDTCALVACIGCVEAVHRYEYEKDNGLGTFPFTLTPDAALDELFIECRRDRTWVRGVGAPVHKVLDNITNKMRGVQATTNGPSTTPRYVLLQVRSYQAYSCDRLSPQDVADLLDSNGPCVGLLWVCPWYKYFNAHRDDTLVYRGCGRSLKDRLESENLYGRDNVGCHAVICFAYRCFGEQEMHVLVLDNHDDTGPRRWIHVQELHEIYTLNVVVQEKPKMLRSKRVVRPNGSVYGSEWTN